MQRDDLREPPEHDSEPTPSPDAPRSGDIASEGHCDHPDCKLCPWIAARFFRDNMFQLRPSDLFGDCEIVTIVVEGCLYHQEHHPSGFACWGKAVIKCPRSSPDEFAFIVRHPRGTETFMVESGAILCEYERECSDDIATLTQIRCVVA